MIFPNFWSEQLFEKNKLLLTLYVAGLKIYRLIGGELLRYGWMISNAILRILRANVDIKIFRFYLTASLFSWSKSSKKYKTSYNLEYLSWISDWKPPKKNKKSGFCMKLGYKSKDTWFLWCLSGKIKIKLNQKWNPWWI